MASWHTLNIHSPSDGPMGAQITSINAAALLEKLHDQHRQNMTKLKQEQISNSDKH